jgi:hypothetical protein
VGSIGARQYVYLGDASTIGKYDPQNGTFAGLPGDPIAENTDTGAYTLQYPENLGLIIAGADNGKVSLLNPSDLSTVASATVGNSRCYDVEYDHSTGMIYAILGDEYDGYMAAFDSSLTLINETATSGDHGSGTISAANGLVWVGGKNALERRTEDLSGVAVSKPIEPNYGVNTPGITYNGTVWVGNSYDAKWFKLDAETGAVLKSDATFGLPYDHYEWQEMFVAEAAELGGLWVFGEIDNTRLCWSWVDLETEDLISWGLGSIGTPPADPGWPLANHFHPTRHNTVIYDIGDADGEPYVHTLTGTQMGRLDANTYSITSVRTYPGEPLPEQYRDWSDN